MLTLSAACYAPNTPVPMREESLHGGAPHETNYSYAFAKRLIDPLVKAYRKEYGMDLVGIISGAIIGPRCNFNPNMATAIPAMIRRFYEERNSNNPISLTLFGDGSQIRQFTSDEDMGRIAMWFIDHYSNEQVLNVATPEETSLRDALCIVAESMGIDKSRLVFDTTKPRGAHSQSLDNSKFVSLSGFKYAPVRDTIKRTVDYFVQNYPDSERLRL